VNILQKVINLCTRVEGNGKVKCFLKNDKIEYVEFEISAFRGFENILVGKKLCDIPRIVSRICGLCHISQTLASCKAIEQIFDVKPSFQSVIIRRILMTAELIKSHIMHVFFQSLPDLLEIFKIKNTSPNPYNLIKFDPQLTISVYDLIKIGTEIEKIFGGRIIHLITPIPGGIVYKPSEKNILITQKYLQKALSNIDYIISKFLDLFSTKQAPEEFSLSNVTYLGMLNKRSFDRYEGTLNLGKNKENITDFDVEKYNDYFDKNPNLFGIRFLSEEYNNVLTGPMARYHLAEIDNEEEMELLNNFDENWKNNILFMNFLQLLEIFNEINSVLELLDHNDLNTKEILPSLNNIKNSDGIGIVEAPRGTLIHHYHLNKSNIVDQVKLFIATEINIPLLNQCLKEYAQSLYQKEDIESVSRKIQVLIRAFDPCISCATH